MLTVTAGLQAKCSGKSYLDLFVNGEFGFYKPAAEVTLEFETSGWE